MPPKSSNKKANTATWYHCENCEAHITVKARETHEKCCSNINNAKDALADNNSVAPLEYIRNGTIYTASVEKFTLSIESLQTLPRRYVDNLIFISEGAIRLAKLHIGQQVLITTANVDTGLVRIVWPTSEQFQTTVFATETDLQLYWTPYKGKVISIKALEHDIVSNAKFVRLTLENDRETHLETAQFKDVCRVLKQEIKNFIYCKGSQIHLNFFNKSLQLSVLDWQGIEAQSEEESACLEQKFKAMCLNGNPHYLKINNATKLEIILKTKEKHNEDKKELHSLITKSDIGGLDRQIQLIEESIEYALGYKQLPAGVKISRGLLIYGATGCGKSLICEAMCNSVRKQQSNTQIIKINSSELYSKFLGETEKNLATYFEQAYAHFPASTLMLLEDVHNLCPKHESSETIKRVSAAFLSMLDQLGHKHEAQRTFILATTSQIDALHTSIRRCGRLDCEIELGAPTPQGRIEILKCLLQKLPHELTASEIEQVAQITHGFVGADLANLVYSATLSIMKSTDVSRKLHLADINAAMMHVKPSAMREVLIENPNVHWSDIGGQAELKLKLQQAIEWPLLHPEKFKRLGIKPPRGLLMFGPPGCSKTMIAKALATESKLNFLSIKGPELFSMWVGESERAVREVFRKARQVAPSIVFFDEIDAIGGERADASGGSGASVKERVLTQLLTELDGVETLQNVTIVAATNRPDMIDKALLRPGRIDRIVYVGLPDAAARREILTIKLRKMPLSEDVQIERLVERTVNYSGAEIQAVCHEAALKTLEQNFDAEHVTWQEFEYALNAVQPRTSPELLKLYEEYMQRS